MTAILLSALLCAPTRLSAAPAETPVLAGVVAEAMDSGGYTYVLLKEGKSSQWAAVPPMKVKVGQKLSLQPGMVMKNFKSPSLKRTFKSIIFSGGPAGEAAASDPHGGMGMGPEHGTGKPAMGHGGSSVPLQQGLKIEKAPGPDGVTVAGLHGRAKELDGKQVAVRGTIVKVSQAIMGRNWVHLQDGTGSAKQKNYDLVLTTTELPEAGETAVFKGTARRDRDMGMGLRYPLIVEDAVKSK
ncbi:MAG: DNA-binding protein [Elusimicrobiota bacterium]|jgi:hypothetical protein